MIRNLPIIALTFFCIHFRAQSFVATYGFADVNSSSGNADPSPTPTVKGLVFGSFVAMGTPANSNATGRFSFTDWPLGAMDGVDSYAMFTGALSAMMYYEVNIAVVPGNTLSLNAISFAVRRSGTGIRNYCVRSNVDNFSNDLTAGTGASSKLSVIPTNVFFWNYDSVSTASDQKGSCIYLNSSFSSISSSVVFRFYAWNAEANGGSFSIDNVVFSGSVKDSVSQFTGIENEEPLKDSELVVYPNPSTQGTIQIKVAQTCSKIELHDAFGRTVISKSTSGPAWNFELNVQDLSAGLYFLRAISFKKTEVKKVLIGH